MTQRITKEEVIAAYRHFSMRPVRHEYGQPGFWSCERPCGCPALAVACARSGIPSRYLPMTAHAFVDEELGHAYAAGFVAAIDAEPYTCPERFFATDEAEFRQGYQDGVKIALAWYDIVERSEA